MGLGQGRAGVTFNFSLGRGRAGVTFNFLTLNFHHGAGQCGVRVWGV